MSAESMFNRCIEIRNAMQANGVNIESMPPFVCTLADLEEFRNIAQIAGPPPQEGDMVMIAGIQFYVRPTEPVPFYGIWHEAWNACLSAHSIDVTDRERERCEFASRTSYYNPRREDAPRN